MVSPQPSRVALTDAAVSLLRRLTAVHGPLMFHQSGGCCDGSSPMCYLAGEFRTGASDVLLAMLEADGVPDPIGFWMSAAQFGYWQHTHLTVDVVPGRGGGFSLEAPEGVRFIIRSRLLTDEEAAALRQTRHDERESDVAAPSTDLRSQPGAETLRDRVALVTGGTRGIGAAICRQLAAAGAGIAAGYWRGTQAAEKLQSTLAAEYPGRLTTLHEGNIGAAADCRRVLREVIDQHGRLDILINNAGITIDKTVAKMTDEDWQRVIAVNLSGAFFMAQAALEHMLERGTGRIISVSSVIGETGNIGQANYAASKSGLFGLTKSLAKEAIFQLNRSGRPVGDGVGLTVNAVTPGFIATDMLATIPDNLLDRIRGQIPVGRLGTPEEIARVVAFLAADQSAYITGQIWAVNGGLDM